MLPDKDYYTPKDLAPYFGVSVDTVKRMGIPFNPLSPRIYRVHKEDFEQWELAKRANTGALKSSEAVNHTPPRSAQGQKRNSSKRQSSNSTSSEELARGLRELSRKHSSNG